MQAAKDGADRGGGVAICHDHAVGLVHRLEIEGILLFKIGLCPFRTRLDRIEVHVNRFLFALEMESQRGVDLFQIDADHLRQHANVDHVADQVAEVTGDVRVAAHDLLDRHGVDGDIGARDGLLDIVSVEKGPARRDRCQVPRERVRVHRDHDLLLFAVAR